jgi:hypothetical protein
VREPRRVRSPGDVDYPLPAVLWTGVWMFLCRLGARRQVNWLLRCPGGDALFQTLFGCGIPHGDAMNDVLRRLEVDEVQECVTRLVERLIDAKILYPYRLLGRYFTVAIDGTGLLVYSERHCAHCLTKKHSNGKTMYYHHVLEAKLVTPTGFAVSVLSEFIENPTDTMTKQDCELKAFYRLAGRLKKRFPRLPLTLLFDGLFANGTVLSLCRKNHWGFFITLKDDQLPSVNEEFNELRAKTHPLVHHTGKGAAITQTFRWVNDIDYVDTKRRHHAVHVLECQHVQRLSPRDPNAIEEPKCTRFKWISAFPLTKDNVIELCNKGGRLRWKIENEGFNVQKNGGYNLEHAYTNDEKGIKIYYFLLQIAATLDQLIQKGDLLGKLFKRGFGSAKNFAFRLLEATRNFPLAPHEYATLIETPIQIRFHPP